MLKENITNDAFFSVFKSINQNSSKKLNHILGLTSSAPSLCSLASCRALRKLPSRLQRMILVFGWKFLLGHRRSVNPHSFWTLESQGCWQIYSAALALTAHKFGDGIFGWKFLLGHRRSVNPYFGLWKVRGAGRFSP